jgi:hypothetical protein
MQPTTRPSNPNIKVQFAILFVFVMDGSYSAESVNHGPVMMAIRDGFVGAVHRLSNQFILARTGCHPNPQPVRSPGGALRLSFPG